MAKGDRADRERRFWKRHIQHLNNKGINQPFDRWHVRRAEEFIRAFPKRRLAEIGAD